MSDRPIDDKIDVEAAIAGVLDELETRRRNRQVLADPTWWAAIDIAHRFGIRKHGSDDSKKKGVRLLMAEVRKRREDLIASFHGYALAVDAADLKKYHDFRKRMGLTHLVAASDVAHSTVADDAAGQMRLTPQA